MVGRFKTSKSRDLTYDQAEIELWAAAEITTGLICVCVPPLAALTHPRHKRRTYMNVHSSDGRVVDSNNNNNSSRRARLMTLDERDLLSTNSDVELQYSNGASAGLGLAFPPSVVTTGISAGRDAHELKYEKSKNEKGGEEFTSDKGQVCEVERGRSANGEIGVTTTVEQYYK